MSENDSILEYTSIVYIVKPTWIDFLFPFSP